MGKLHSLHRQAGRADGQGCAVGQVFGQFDVAHQLDIGIEVEGWRQNAL